MLLLLVVVCAVALAVASIHGWQPEESRDANIAVALSSRLQAAKMLADSGQFAAAQEQLAPLLKDSHGAAFREVRWLSWQLQWEQTMGLPTGSAARTAAWKALQQHTQGMVSLGGWTVQEWQTIATRAAALGDLRLSASAWEEAARSYPKNALYFRQKAAGALATAGEGVKAGMIYLTLAPTEKDPALQSKFFLTGLRLIEGAVGAKVALEQGQNTLRQLPQLAKESNIVLHMASLAMAADEPKIAADILFSALSRGMTPP
ncbi:MAG: hypothetical protein ACYDCV_09520 [Acidithiobacillus sp.]